MGMCAGAAYGSVLGQSFFGNMTMDRKEYEAMDDKKKESTAFLNNRQPFTGGMGNLAERKRINDGSG